MKISLGCFVSLIFVNVVGIVAGCGGDDSSPAGGDGGDGGPSGMKIAASTGEWTAYTNPYGDGGASPISNTIMGSAEAFAAGTGMRVKLTVTGLPASRPFGSHIHKLACDDNKAGAHYQNNPAPDGGANDPMYANSMNEVWLDFVTDASGAGSSEAEVGFVPRAGEAKAVVIHDMATTAGGLAGAKLACLTMTF